MAAADASRNLSFQDTIVLHGRDVKMPIIGYGVWQVAQSDCVAACVAALKAGYRHIDSAQLYRNEAEVGEALRQSGLAREDIFVTTKIGIPRGGDEATYKNVSDSVKLISGEDGYVDLFLVHIPGRTKAARKELWLALERLHKEGKAKSIGVSNFLVEHLEEMKEYATIWPPPVNQIELHPWCQQHQLVSYCQKNDITLQAYSPLAEATRMDDPTLLEVAARNGKTPAQVLVRYSLQKGWVPLPKSVRPERMRENADVFSFVLSDADMAELNGLDRGPEGAQFPKNVSR